ncbi:UDP-glucuronosyltransferase 2B15 [Eumeta japonica]|uniref:UDP-glucuronosyltransferase 2B15 n=1 Tax=Eumeta variegata TaxID=151549 RepID=A0A4C1U5C8_EUMVA|nr:UDP-glucuronosyltransferase 2B15 [Eumeta japonica]
MDRYELKPVRSSASKFLGSWNLEPPRDSPNDSLALPLLSQVDNAFVARPFDTPAPLASTKTIAFPTNHRSPPAPFCSAVFPITRHELIVACSISTLACFNSASRSSVPNSVRSLMLEATEQRGRASASGLVMPVTHVTPFPIDKPAANVRQIDISSVVDDMPSDMIKITNLVKNPFSIHAMAFMGPGMTMGALENKNLRKFLADTTQEFDVVIVEWFFTDVFSGLAALYKAPLIWVSSVDPHWQVLELVDEPSNPAYTASVLTKAIPPFDFFARVNELFMQFYIKFLTTIAHFLIERPAFNKHILPAFEKRGIIPPSHNEMVYNGSFMFFNAQPVLGTGYRLTQNTRYIGGYHIDPNTKPLPENLKKIFDDAKNGVIYFSMGSNLKSKDMSDYTKRGLLEMFGTLKQTVLWKFEEELKDRPPNVHILKWAPQPSILMLEKFEEKLRDLAPKVHIIELVPQLSILSHPKTLLFITHGGKLSTTETIHYGVPVIGIPIFGDQFVNMDQAVHKGYGIKVKYEEDLAKPLKAALDEMLNKPSYTETAKRMSRIFHDVIASPRQELVHWVEHVVRTQGAPHLRSIALHVPWYQKIYLDLIAVTVILLYIVKKSPIERECSYNRYVVQVSSEYLPLCADDSRTESRGAERGLNEDDVSVSTTLIS